MRKNLQRIVAIVAMSALVIGARVSVKAADITEKDVEGGNRSISVYGTAIEIVSKDFIMIIPNNKTLRVDVMINGEVTKGLVELRISKVNHDGVFLEEGSNIINCSSKEQVQDVANQLSKQTSVSVISQEQIKGSGDAVFTIAEDGKIKDANGKEVNKNIFPVRTNSIKEEIKQAEERIEERIKTRQEEESKPVYVPAPKPSTAPAVAPSEEPTTKPTTEASEEPTAEASEAPAP